ncbi:MAG TPA: toll/interleukin-1 receptor domain-containing protein, partial [Thermoanaerobaculia bacterium]|nr:toll/interleukin-1 receptor domain-containing protein [Thermoanaerobaculia bacterium]
MFISYHHSDQSWKERLVTQLAALEGEGILRPWHDGLIKPGVDWLSEIDAAMAAARVALFLVSAPFLTSEFIRRREVPVLVERSKAAGVHVIPLIISPCPWKKVGWLGALQARPRRDLTLSELGRTRAEKVLSELAEEISDLLQADESPGTAPQSPTSLQSSSLARGAERPPSPSPSVAPDHVRAPARPESPASAHPLPSLGKRERRKWRGWAYLAMAAGLAGILFLLFKLAAPPRKAISAPVLPATGESIIFVPDPRVEESVKDQIVTDLAAFAAYLTRLGYRPPGTDVNISFQPPSPFLFVYKPEIHTIFVHPTFARDTDIVLHEYAHRMLLAKQGSFNDLSDTYHAMESGLAYYYPCSFHSRSDFGVIAARDNPQLFRVLTLLNHRSFE